MNQPKSETPLAGGASGKTVALGQRVESNAKAPSRSTGSTSVRPFALYVASRFTDPVEVLTEFMPDAVAAAEEVGATLTEAPVLDGGRHYLRNARGKVDQKQGYVGKFESDADGTVWPCITFMSFKASRPKVFFKPRNLVWEQFQRERAGLATAPCERLDEYKRRASERLARQERIEAERTTNDIAGMRGAAGAAIAAWMSARDCTGHFYLESKNVSAHGLRVAPKNLTAQFWKSEREHWSAMTSVIAGDLLIPMFDVDGELWNVQRIQKLPVEGKHPRRFLPGSRTRGLFYRIGGDGPAWLVEGYATGATVHEATGKPVYVAFSAGNLGAVARALPGVVVAVAADNDLSGAGANGAKETGLPFLMPPTADHDWNDHARVFGLGSVRELLGAFNAG